MCCKHKLNCFPVHFSTFSFVSDSVRVCSSNGNGHYVCCVCGTNAINCFDFGFWRRHGRCWCGSYAFQIFNGCLFAICLPCFLFLNTVNFIVIMCCDFRSFKCCLAVSCSRYSPPIPILNPNRKNPLYVFSNLSARSLPLCAPTTLCRRDFYCVATTKTKKIYIWIDTKTVIACKIVHFICCLLWTFAFSAHCFKFQRPGTENCVRSHSFLWKRFKKAIDIDKKSFKVK